MKLPFAFVVLAIIAPASAATIDGKVTAVKDGDSIIVLDANKVEHHVRLVDIDAPEHDQPFGSRAKQALSEKVFGKQVSVEWEKKDRYDRTLGKVSIGKRLINLEMVADGFAWRYKQYSNEPDLIKAEDQARSAKRGLWADPTPVPPWDYRHKAKPAKKKAA